MLPKIAAWCGSSWGRYCQPELAELDDADLLQLVDEELRDLLCTKGPPILRQISRWPSAMPQYHVGHLKIVAEIEERACIACLGWPWPATPIGASAFRIASTVAKPRRKRSFEADLCRLAAEINAKLRRMERVVGSAGGSGGTQMLIGLLQ